MASFCTKCGATLNESSAFCPNCGAPAGAQVAANQAPLNPQTPLNTQAPVATAAPVKAAKPKAPKAPKVKPVSAHADGAKPNDAIQNFIDKVKFNPKSMALPFGIILVAVLAVFVITTILGSRYGSATMNGAIKNYLKAQTGDVSAIKKSQPKFYYDYLKDEEDYSTKEINEEIEDTAEMLEELLEEKYGKNVKISDIKVKDKDKLDKDDIEDLEDALEDRYDKKINISKAYEVEVKYKIKGKDESERLESTLIVIKIDGRWYIM